MLEVWLCASSYSFGYSSEGGRTYAPVVSVVSIFQLRIESEMICGLFCVTRARVNHLR